MEHTLNDPQLQQTEEVDKNAAKPEKGENALEGSEGVDPGETPLTVTFIPTGEGELKEIPGFGQVLETRSVQVSVLLLKMHIILKVVLTEKIPYMHLH